MGGIQMYQFLERSYRNLGEICHCCYLKAYHLHTCLREHNIHPVHNPMVEMIQFEGSNAHILHLK